jgi:hypothetical protein
MNARRAEALTDRWRKSFRNGVYCRRGSKFGLDGLREFVHCLLQNCVEGIDSLVSLASQSAAPRALKLRARWYTPCMGNLEKLSWIDAFAVTGYGVRVGVRVNDDALIERLRPRLPPGAKISPMGTVDRILSVILAPPSERRGVKNYHLVYSNHDLVGRSHRLDVVLDNYDTHLRMAMAEFSRRKLFVHAGVVAWKERAILLPGSTLAGKTHLVAELVKAGAAYLSDEYAILDEDGWVHPFAKPLSMRPSKTGPQIETPVEQIGGVPGRKPLPVGLVVMSQFREGARWRPKRLTAGQGVLELLDNAFSARRSPEFAMNILGRVASGATVLKGTRGDATTMTGHILDAAEAGGSA